MTAGRSWDLIVVGAGSAGAPLAARAASRGRRVLLLEAGPDYRSAEMHPAWRSPNPIRAILDPKSTGDLIWPDLDASRTDRQAPYLYWRGRGAGGSSSVNGQIAIRPPREDFDDWAAAGCEGWSWADLLPYFCRIETDADYGDKPYHGSSGPIPVYRTPRSEWGSVDEALARAAAAAGFGWADDLNAPGATGVSPYPINSRDFRRVSTNDAYLEPARGLDSLTVRGGALVDRVLIQSNRAVGVEFRHAAQSVREYADEVVLSAGAIHTPPILIRSGIGPASLLAQLGIEAVADLPVGEGLQDHPMLTIRLPLRAAAAIKTPDDRHTNCCIRFDSGDADGTPADMMMVALNQMALAMQTADASPRAGAVGVWVNQVYSRGTVTAGSRNPSDQPAVRERMLSDERDIRRLRAGARLLFELATRDEIAEICAAPVEQANADLWKALAGSDSDLDDYLLSSVVDAQHGTSTCRMGPASSDVAVVDPQCRVRGIEALRIADASIFPTCPRANTNLATVVIGEAVADLLST